MGLVFLFALFSTGIIYAFRKSKLKRRTPEQYPSMPPEKFHEWRKLELKSINLVLWATWGMLIGLPVAFALVENVGNDVGGILLIVCFMLFIILLVMASIRRSKAAKLKKQFGVKWP